MYTVVCTWLIQVLVKITLQKYMLCTFYLLVSIYLFIYLLLYHLFWNKCLLVYGKLVFLQSKVYCHPLSQFEHRFLNLCPCYLRYIYINFIIITALVTVTASKYYGAYGLNQTFGYKLLVKFVIQVQKSKINARNSKPSCPS